MKKNRIIIIVTIVLLLIAIILIFSRTKSTLRGDISDFAIEDTSKVTRIFLADKDGNEVTLERKNDAEWIINGKFDASIYKVNSLLKTMNDLKVRAPVPLSAHNTVVRRLASASVKVEIYQVKPWLNIFNWIKLFNKERLVKTYYVGGPSQDNLGTYMLMENSTKPYLVYIPRFRGFLTPRYSAKETDWRDHQIFDHEIDDIRTIELTFFKKPKESYKVYNIDNLHFDVIDQYKKDTLKDFDTLKLISFVTAFEDMKCEAILTKSLKQQFIDSVTSTRPVHRITVVDKKGDTTQLITYYKKGFSHLYQEDGAALEPFDLDRLYGLTRKTGDFVMLQYFVFDKVLRPLSYFTKDRTGN